MTFARLFGVAAILSGLSIGAHSQITFSGSKQYDVLSQNVAVAGSYNNNFFSSSSGVIEVHQAGTANQLYYRLGFGGCNQNTGCGFQWTSPSYLFDSNGDTPSVGYGISNGSTTVVEVHQGGSNVGTIWYRVGTVASNNTVNWGPSRLLAYGYHPSVSAVNLQLNNTTTLNVIVTFNASSGPSALLYSAGKVVGNAVSWSTPAQYDSYGLRPSVSMSSCAYNQQMITSCPILEVHNGGAGFGPMWYHVGQLMGNGNVVWGGAVEYDLGLNPTLTLTSPESFFETHNGSTGPGLSYYHSIAAGYTGLLQAQVGPSVNYGDGYSWNPAPANAGVLLIEVHADTTGSANLFYRVENR